MSVSATSTKRGFASLFQSFTGGTFEVNALFQMVADVDFTQQSGSPEVNSMIGFTELIDLKEVVSRRSYFLVPSEKPVGGGICDLEFIFSASSVVCGLEADLTATGGGILVRVYGEFSPAEGKTAFENLKEIRLDVVPSLFWVPKLGANVIPSVFGSAINDVVCGASSKRIRNLPIGTTGGSLTGGSGRDDGGVVRKAARIEVVDMNNEIRVVINKEDAQKRVNLLGGLLREATSQV